jgi:hypothetical protein
MVTKPSGRAGKGQIWVSCNRSSATVAQLPLQGRHTENRTGNPRSGRRVVRCRCAPRGGGWPNAAAADHCTSSCQSTRCALQLAAGRTADAAAGADIVRPAARYPLRGSVWQLDVRAGPQRRCFRQGTGLMPIAWTSGYGCPTASYSPRTFLQTTPDKWIPPGPKYGRRDRPSCP